MIKKVTPNRKTLLFFATAASTSVILDFSELLTLISLSVEKILIKVGNKIKVTNIETIKPRLIIHPKSIIGFIPLKIKDKKAQIVVNTV